MTAYGSAMRGREVTLLDTQHVLNTVGSVAIPSSFTQHQVQIVGGAGIASGKAIVETADTEDYAGTWAQPVGGEITIAASTAYTVNFNGLYKFIRVRISTVFVGGDISATYTGS